MWKLQNLNLFVDITTRCNVGCPMCHRTNTKGCGTADWLPNIDWSIEQFKQAYPENVCKRAEIFNLCGTWGDPIINKDILKIVQYIRDTNMFSRIIINTNGSLRNEDFWWELGKIGDKRLTVIFAVEGTTQEMHERYRQKSFLNKVLNNMLTLSYTNAKVETQTILFKHNVDYIKDIEKLCKEHGSVMHNIIETNRYQYGTNRFDFINAKGKDDYLERPDDQSVTKLPKNYLNLDEHELSIECSWAKKNKIVINPDGQVLPCCYLCNPYFEYQQSSNEIYGHFMRNELIKNYKEKEFNVFHNNLLDIIAQQWFQKDLKESFTSEQPLSQCVKNCTKLSVSSKISRERL